MTRRLVLAILGTAIAALLLAGLGTFLLTAATARRSTQRAVLAQSIDIANNFAKVEPNLANRPGVADTVQRIFRIDGLAFLHEDTSGKLVGTPPKGVSPLLLNPAALLAGKRLSGHAGKLVWAAAPAKTADGSTVVAVLVRKVANSFLSAWRWFLLASGAVVLIGALVAVSLSRRLTRPIRQADQAARRIAAGELSTR